MRGRDDAKGPRTTLSERFRAFSTAVSVGFGSPWALAIALVLIAVWAISGPYFGFSDAWQLVINTGTTIVTFLMAFLIQATQYRESRAINLKVDELIRAVQGARTGFVNLEKLSDQEIERLTNEIASLGKARITPLRVKNAVAKAHDDRVAGATRRRRSAKSPPRGA